MVRILLGIFLTALLSPTVYGLDQTPIRIITNNWTSQIVLSHITGDLLEKLGYRVEYVPSSVDAQWADMAHGINLGRHHGRQTGPGKRCRACCGVR